MRQPPAIETVCGGVRVVRVDVRRRARIVRAMLRDGWPEWTVRAAFGLSRAGFARCLARPTGGMWGAELAAALAAEG